MTAIGAFYVAYSLKQNVIDSDDVAVDVFRPSIIEKTKVEGEVVCRLPHKEEVQVKISMEMHRQADSSERE